LKPGSPVISLGFTREPFNMQPSPVRIARIYLASIPSPSALKMLKVMTEGAGKTGSINVNLLSEVLGLMGWEIKEKVGAKPLDAAEKIEHLLADVLRPLHTTTWSYSGVKNPVEFWFRNEEEARKGAAEILRAVELAPKTGPMSPVTGKVYVHLFNPEPFIRPHNGILAITTQFWWLGVPAWDLKAANGATATITLGVDRWGRLDDPTKMKMPSFWTWGYKNGLQEAAQKALDDIGAKVVEKAIRLPSARNLLGTGTCPACFSNVKLSGGTMMRHGWEVQGRRGWGQYGASWHSAACFGFHWPPYEVSKTGTEAYLEKAVKPSLKGAQEQLRRLQAGPDKLLTKDFRGKPLELVKPEGFAFDLTKYYVSDSYEQHLQHLIRGVLYDIAGMEDLQRTLEAKIKEWKPQPLPGD
jgi:hypothetical protein